MTHDFHELLPQVIDVAEAAGRLIAEEFVRPRGPRGGGEHAEIDREAEEIIRARLLALLPARFRGEETGSADPAPGPGAFCWLVDPNDGTSAFFKGHRGSAISIALLREGVPLLGVVHAALSPDRGSETIACAEGIDGVFRNGHLIRHRLDRRSLDPGTVVFVSQASSQRPASDAALAHPGRFVAVLSIAYRLARVAVVDGVGAVSLASPVAWDYAAEHALIRAAGGVLVDEGGREIRYTREDESLCSACFGGAPDVASGLARRDWQAVRREPSPPRRVGLAWPRAPEDMSLDRAIGCLLGLLVGDSLGSLAEFQSAAQIARNHPQGVRDLADGSVWDTLAGQPTDDGELALALAHTLARLEAWSSEAVVDAYVGWLLSRLFDVGLTTQLALAAAAVAEAGARAEAAPRGANAESQANGALMRCAPIGVWADSEDEAAEAAAEDAASTHPHPICRAASASFAAAIHPGIAGADRMAMFSAAERALGRHDA